MQLNGFVSAQTVGMKGKQQKEPANVETSGAMKGNEKGGRRRGDGTSQR